MAQIFVTAAIDGGKTTLLKVLIGYLQSGEPRPEWLGDSFLKDKLGSIGGFLTEAELTDGRKTAYRAVSIDEHFKVDLVAEQPRGKEWAAGPKRFWHNPAGFSLLFERVSKQMDRDVIIIDEAGPLEMAGGGHSKLLNRLAEEYSGLLILAVRADLADTATNLWGRDNYKIVKVTPGIPGAAEYQL